MHCLPPHRRATPAIETPLAPSRTKRPSTQLLARAAVLAALALGAALPTAATARPADPHGKAAAHACSPVTKTSARRSHRTSKHVCPRRHVRKHTAHKPRKTTRKATPPAVELVPAVCEDGTLPSHSVGSAYSCEDGSAPSCEEGTLVRATPTAGPMCAVKGPAEGEQRCSREGAGECAVEFACEDGAGGEASRNCERGGEAEAGEAEEEE